MKAIRMKRFTYSGEREQFTLSVDVYEDWVLLAAQKGSFAFALEQAEGNRDRVIAGIEEESGVFDNANGNVQDWPQEGTAEFGELVFCPPGTVLRRHALEPFIFHFAEFEMDGDKAAAVLPPRGGKIRIRDAQRLASTFGYMAKLHEQPPEEIKPAIGHLIEDLLFLIEQERQSAVRASKRKAAEPLMHQAAAHIGQYACEVGLSLQLLADKLGISGPQLTRRFRTAYGISPIDYATEVRMAHARKLLIETDETLDVIAERCGYQTAFYFSRVFTRFMQQSPSAYRKAYRV